MKMYLFSMTVQRPQLKLDIPKWSNADKETIKRNQCIWFVEAVFGTGSADRLLLCNKLFMITFHL